jgi:hypothetical protein
LIGKLAERRPSTSTRVDETPRPRSETAEPPALKPPWKPVGIEPAPSAEIERMASAAVLMPARCRFSEVSTVTGDGVSVSVRRNSEPVTTISSTCVCSAAGAVCATAWLAPSRATAVPQIMEEASRRSRMDFVFKFNSPASSAQDGRARLQTRRRVRLAGSYGSK